MQVDSKRNDFRGCDRIVYNENYCVRRAVVDSHPSSSSSSFLAASDRYFVVSNCQSGKRGSLGFFLGIFWTSFLFENFFSFFFFWNTTRIAWNVTASIPKCGGCQEAILDKYVLRVLERCWHARCLTCRDCGARLTDKCFARNGHVFCKDDFFK